MRSTLFLVMFLLACLPALQAQRNGDYTIEVVGSVSRIVTPDEVFVNLTLKPYKNAANIVVSAAQLEAGLTKAILAAGLDSNNLTLQNYYKYRYDQKRRTPAEKELEQRSYTLKISKPEQLDALLDQIDLKGLSSLTLGASHFKDEEKIRTELNALAVLDARKTANSFFVSENVLPGRILAVKTKSNTSNGYDFGGEFGDDDFDGESELIKPAFNVQFDSIVITVELTVTFEIIDKP